MKSFFNKYIKNFRCDWANKSDVLIKVEKDGLNLKYADYGLRDDFDVVLTAIEDNPLSLEFASRVLKNDKKIALAAIENGSSQFISDELKNNLEFAKDVWNSTKKLTPKSYSHPENILPPLYSDSSVWLELAKHSYAIITVRHFKNMSDDLKSNKDFMLKLIKEEAMCFQLASEELRDDDKLAQLAIEGWCFNLQHTSKRIKDSEKFHELFLKAAWELQLISYGGKEKVKDMSDKLITDILLENQKQLKRIVTGKNPFR
jgi:hypothetical protein